MASTIDLVFWIPGIETSGSRTCGGGEQSAQARRQKFNHKKPEIEVKNCQHRALFERWNPAVEKKQQGPHREKNPTLRAARRVVGAAPFAVGERPAGTSYGYHVASKFSASSGTGTRVEGRPCTVTFTKSATAP